MAYTSNGFNATSGQMHCDSCVIADPMGTPTAAHQQRAKPAARSCIRSLSIVHLCCSHAAAAGCARNGETRAPAVKGREPAGREYEFTVRRSNHLCHRTCVGDSPLTLAMSDTVWRSTHTAAYVRGGCKPDSQPPDLLARRSRRRHRQSARRWGHPLSDNRRGAERDVARRYDSAAPEPRRPPRMQFQCSGVDGARQASAALRLAHSVVCPPRYPPSLLPALSCSAMHRLGTRLMQTGDSACSHAQNSRLSTISDLFVAFYHGSATPARQHHAHADVGACVCTAATLSSGWGGRTATARQPPWTLGAVGGAAAVRRVAEAGAVGLLVLWGLKPGRCRAIFRSLAAQRCGSRRLWHAVLRART